MYIFVTTDVWSVAITCNYKISALLIVVTYLRKFNRCVPVQTRPIWYINSLLVQKINVFIQVNTFSLMSTLFAKHLNYFLVVGIDRT
jgi:hypothetical protein